MKNRRGLGLVVLLTVCMTVSVRTVSMAQEPSPPLPGASCAICEWLYLATNFNALIFGDYTAYGGDCEAFLAVGGTFKVVNGYSVGYPMVGEPLPTYTNGTTDMLIIGGDFYDRNNFGVNGNIVYGGTRYSNCTRYPTAENNQVYHATNIIFDAAGNVSRDGTGKTWDELYDIAVAASARMAALEDRGVVTKDFTQRYSAYLTGDDPSLNVFHVNAQEWSKTSAGYIIEAPAGSVVLINIHGGDVAITNSSMNLTGVDTNHVILNYVDATHISTKSFAHNGSVLAPYASGTFSGGSINGYAVFGGDVEGSIGFQFHNFPFRGGCFDEDFHNKLVGVIGDRVWEDLNGNGIQDPGEPGIANVVVRLLDGQGVEIASTLTDADGFYLFTGLAPSLYAVKFDPPAGYLLTSHKAGTDSSVDSDAAPGTLQTENFALPLGATNLTMDAGFYISAMVKGYVFKDLDDNGIFDGPDSAITNVLVCLSVNGEVICSIPTDTTGYYEFNDVPPGEITLQVSRNGADLAKIPTADPYASDQRRTRALLDRSGINACIDCDVRSGQGVIEGCNCETMNFGFVTYPYSLAIDVSIYATAEGAVVEIWTVDECGHDDIVVYAWIGNDWVEVGRVPGEEVVGEFSNYYTVYTDMLEAGASYYLRIVDEAGYVHTSAQPLTVKTVRMEAVRLDMQMIELTFTTEPGERYSVMVSTDMVNWAKEAVSYPLYNGGMSPVGKKPFRALSGTRTTVRVPLNGRARAFFKIQRVE